MKIFLVAGCESRIRNQRARGSHGVARVRFTSLHRIASREYILFETTATGFDGTHYPMMRVGISCETRTKIYTYRNYVRLRAMSERPRVTVSTSPDEQFTTVSNVEAPGSEGSVAEWLSGLNQLFWCESRNRCQLAT